MKVLLVVLVSTLFCLHATAGSIDTTVQFVTLPGTAGNAPGNFMNNTYNGYVGAYIDGSASLSQIICDDFNDTTYVPSGPTPYFATTLADVGAPGSTTLYSSSADYEAAAILANDFLGLTGTDAVTQNSITLDQYAIWDLTAPNGPAFAANGTDSNTVAQNALTQASADPNNPLYGNLIIYTPQAQGTNQEFLGFAPEPSSIFLMLGGAVVLAFGVRRSRLLKAQS